MALIPIYPQGGIDPATRQMIAAQQIGGSIGQFGDAQKKQRAEMALAEAIGGKQGQGPKALAPGAASEAGLWANLMGSAQGLGAPQGPPTPPTPGLIPGISEADALAMAQNPQLIPLFMPQPQGPIKLGPGDTLLDPATNQPLFQAPAQAASVLGKIAADLNLDLSTPEGFAAAVQAIQATQPPGASVEVNLPANRPPLKAGEQYVLDERGEVVGIRELPGGEVARERLAKEQQEASKARTQATAARIVVEDINTALDIIEEHGSFAAGRGSLLSFIPESQAKVLDTTIKSVQSNIGVDQLLKIKEAGSGLGQVPQSQLEMLASLLGALDPSLPPDILARNLQRVGEVYSEIVELNGGALPTAQSAASAEQPASPVALRDEAINLGTGERTATNPETGQRLILRNGEWVPF